MNKIRKEGFYQWWRWSQASGVVVGRCSGEAMQCGQTYTGEEDNWVLLCSFLPFILSQKRRKYCELKILAAPPLHGEVSKTNKKPTA